MHQMLALALLQSDPQRFTVRLPASPAAAACPSLLRESSCCVKPPLSDMCRTCPHPGHCLNLLLQRSLALPWPPRCCQHHAQVRLAAHPCRSPSPTLRTHLPLSGSLPLKTQSSRPRCLRHHLWGNAPGTSRGCTGPCGPLWPGGCRACLPACWEAPTSRPWRGGAAPS